MGRCLEVECLRSIESRHGLVWGDSKICHVAVEWDSEREWKCRPLKLRRPQNLRQKCFTSYSLKPPKTTTGVGVEKLPGPH